MYITSPKRKNGSTVIRLVECFRKDGKVKNRIVKTIGQSKDPQIIKHYKTIAKQILEKQKKGLIQLSKFSERIPIDLSRFLGQERYNNGFEDIFGASYKSLGFSDLIKSGKDNKFLNEILRSLVLMRVFSPVSKLRSCRLLRERFNKFFSHKSVLNMMDHLSKREEEIRGRVFQSVSKSKDSFEMLLFDVTTLYFESVSSDDLRDFGYSKDGKFNEVQVVLAVLSDEEGLPMAYEIFSGNTGEVKTMKAVLSSFVRKHKVRRVRVVADRGMFSEDNFSFFEDLRKGEGIKAEYVVSCPLKKLPSDIKEQIFDFKRRQGEFKREGESSGKSPAYYEFSYKGRKILVSYSEKLRAQDEKKRQKILDKLSNLAKGGQIPSSRLVKNTGVRRYLKTLRGKVGIDREKIFKDSLWDGLYGVCSNIEAGTSPQQLLSIYSSLWKIEELFRINKHTLRMRPIYHRLARRIRAHILICFLAYVVLRQTEIKLAKRGLVFSPQELIDILQEVESFIIRDKIKKPEISYCLPRALSKEAQKIYSVFKKSYPKQAYKLEGGLKKKNLNTQ